ncbi:uncharacterized protein LOC135401008 [Ornithodoros turicata]|uniref:uncharacterized protein LOC135401008 n=1 Tax=Ornithodoros turicata TaxID=34597 RepID=UPI003139423F
MHHISFPSLLQICHARVQDRSHERQRRRLQEWDGRRQDQGGLGYDGVGEVLAGGEEQPSRFYGMDVPAAVCGTGGFRKRLRSTTRCSRFKQRPRNVRQKTTRQVERRKSSLR